ncbi:MAG: alcohol dehydrogenase-like regulatory protein ErcA [Armatimonadota bacterium]
MPSGGILELRKFVAPECVFGADARNLAAKYALNLGARKVLVVTDPGVIACGWTDDVMTGLRDAGLPYVVFENVSPNPRDNEVLSGSEVYLAEQCNSIIAVGGGSPIDCAKGVGIVSTNDRNILEFEGVDEVRIPIPPLICVPTTGGSSADVSQFAIITDTTRKVKIAIVSKAIVPDVSLVDPVTLTTLPADLTADTGFDALTHAFEAYVSNAQSAITDLFALEAIRLVHNYLPASIADPLNIELRGWMAIACLHAGFAFSNAGLGLVHAMSHSLGGTTDIAHGLSNAILLRHVVEFNFPSAADRYRAIGQAMGLRLSGKGDEEACTDIINELTRFQESVGITGTLGKYGLDRTMIRELAGKAMADPDIATAVRQPSQQDIEDIYERAF